MKKIKVNETTAIRILLIDIAVIILMIPLILINYYFIGSKIIMKILCVIVFIGFIIIQIEALFNGKLKEILFSEH